MGRCWRNSSGRSRTPGCCRWGSGRFVRVKQRSRQAATEVASYERKSPAHREGAGDFLTSGLHGCLQHCWPIRRPIAGWRPPKEPQLPMGVPCQSGNVPARAHVYCSLACPASPLHCQRGWPFTIRAWVAAVAELAGKHLDWLAERRQDNPALGRGFNRHGQAGGGAETFIA